VLRSIKKIQNSASVKFWALTEVFMKDSVLLELAKKWDIDAQPTILCEPRSPEMALSNAEAHGIRQGQRMCADALRMLVDLLGDKDA
jgi:hypothetical protein